MSKSALRVTLGLILVAVVFASAPAWAGRADLRLYGEFMSYLALAVLWNLLAGYAGLMSVGQQAFVGLGAYVLFIGVVTLGMSPLLTLPVAFVVTGIAAAFFALLLFRLEGAYFAIGTWVAAESVALVFAGIPSLGGGAGMSLPAAAVRGIADSREMREFVIYWLLCGLGIGTLAAAYALIRSKPGLALMALRDNPMAAMSVGVDIKRIRFWTYVLVAALTGVIGAVIFLQKLRVSPQAAFSLPDWTVAVIFIVVIGGIGRLEGAVVGTVVYFVLRELLKDYGVAYLIVLGIVAILVVTFSGGGLWGLVEKHLRWSLMPTHRKRDG
ncbi:MAG: branched-chain amino acid ABC transporter permease [Rhodobacter sp.]|nr:branched-chain amino acid ABC transporter permease [Paracoccaceae bacterium]MCC0077559.1 branched-chain amino acid ABC transporter permease [Rhodobacter sp.]